MLPVSPASRATIPLNQRGEVWFDDGNIILRAETTLFRVYKGILAEQCLVFRNMLNLPPPDADVNMAHGEWNRDEVYDGCPVVVLHDRTRELMHFLKALHTFE